RVVGVRAGWNEALPNGLHGHLTRAVQLACLSSRSTAKFAEVTALTSSTVAPSSSSTSTRPPWRTRKTESSVITTSTAPFAVSGEVETGTAVGAAAGYAT